jgi:hypothetical protein
MRIATGRKKSICANDVLSSRTAALLENVRCLNEMNLFTLASKWNLLDLSSLTINDLQSRVSLRCDKETLSIAVV